MPVAGEVELVVCVIGIFASYLWYGVVQEELTQSRFGAGEEKFQAAFFLIVLQCAANALAALVLLRGPIASAVIGDQTPHPPRKAAAKSLPGPAASAYVPAAVSYVAAMLCSNGALTFSSVSYPTMALAKSCKPVPVMLMRTLVLRRRESWFRYAAVLMITAGVSWFMLLQNAKKGRDGGASGTLGLSLLLASLFFDGLTGPTQERLREPVPDRRPPTSVEVMLWQNIWAALLVLPVGILTGDMWRGVDFLQRHPTALRLVLWYAFTSAVGQNFIFYTLVRFDSLVLSIVTTTRKFATILLSVVRFGNALSLPEWSGVAIVFAGLALDVADSKGLLKRFYAPSSSSSAAASSSDKKGK